jgi:hypothetical protein
MSLAVEFQEAVIVHLVDRLKMDFTAENDPFEFHEGMGLDDFSQQPQACI